MKGPKQNVYQNISENRKGKKKKKEKNVSIMTVMKNRMT